MRVALVATVTDFGGIEQVLLTLLRHMGGRIELFPILFTRKDADQAAFFDHLQRLDVPHVTFVNTRKRRYVNVLRNLRDAFAIFRRERFDLVHCHGYRADLLGFLVAKWFHLPVVTTVHGFTSTDRHLRLNKRVNVAVLRRFTRIMTVSQQLKDDVVALGIDAHRVDVITNAVAETAPGPAADRRRDIRARLGIDESAFVFGFVGRLSEEKGVADLLRALQALAATRPATHAILVGDGPQRSALEQAARDAGLTGIVHFVGFQNHTSEWYPAMDAFVLPSLTEGTPMALLEAMAHGIPVLATAVGGVPAIVEHRVNGLLVPAADPEKLAEAMRLLSSDAELRRNLTDEAARSVRQQFDVHSWTRRVHEVYLSAIQTFAGAR